MKNIKLNKVKELVYTTKIYLKIIILLYALHPSSIYSAPTKIFINQFKANDQQLEKEFRTEIKDALSNSGVYTVIDEDAYGGLLENLKKHQLLGCDENRCIQEISNALDVDETLNGEIQNYGNSYFIQLKSTVRDSKNFSISSRYFLQIRIPSSGKKLFIREFLKYSQNPSYKIVIPDKMKRLYLEMQYNFEKMEPLPKYSISGLDTGEDKIKTKEDIIKLYINKGDYYYKNRKYLESYKEYKLLEDKFSESIFNEDKLLDKNIISERKDMIFSTLLHEEAESFYSIISKTNKWRLEDLEDRIYPMLLSLESYDKANLSTQKEKENYDKIERVLLDWKCGLQMILLKLYFYNDKIEKYFNLFSTFETNLSVYKGINYQLYNSFYQVELKNIATLKEKYFPSWNEELKNNCSGIQLAIRFYRNNPYSSMEELAFERYKQIYTNSKKRIVEGYKAMSIETYRECYGIIPPDVRKTYENLSGIIK